MNPKLPKLVIGNRNYSSWSLRAWLALRHSGFVFDCHLLPLKTPLFKDEVHRYSPSARVPSLIVDDYIIWDSLAIAEYAAEVTSLGWPRDVRARAVARSVCAEMHSSFQTMRACWPMDIRAIYQDDRQLDQVLPDLTRVTDIWTHCRSQFGGAGPWLFGEYSVADAFFAPVVCRLHTYARPFKSSLISEYCSTTLADPHLQEWTTLAFAEVESLS